MKQEISTPFIGAIVAAIAVILVVISYFLFGRNSGTASVAPGELPALKQSTTVKPATSREAGLKMMGR